jgi:hypothetical protein
MQLPASVRRVLVAVPSLWAFAPVLSQGPASRIALTDSHFHLTNYVQRGPTLTSFLKLPDRFLFGTDAVAPKTAAAYLVTNELYRPLWSALTPDARAKVRVENYERLFDAARRKVRAWEAAHAR